MNEPKRKGMRLTKVILKRSHWHSALVFARVLDCEETIESDLFQNCKLKSLLHSAISTIEERLRGSILFALKGNEQTKTNKQYIALREPYVFLSMLIYTTLSYSGR